MNIKALKHLLLGKDTGRVLVERGNEETYYLTDGVAMWRFHAPMAELPDKLKQLNLGIPDLAVGETYKFQRTVKQWQQDPVASYQGVCQQVWQRHETERTTYLTSTLLATPFEDRAAIWFAPISGGDAGVFLDQMYLRMMEHTPQTVRALTLKSVTESRSLNEPVEMDFGVVDIQSLTLLLCPVVVGTNELSALRKQAQGFVEAVHG